MLFYFIIFSFWSEAHLNEHISPNTCVYLINTLIHILFQLLNEYSKNLPENVSMKNKPFCSQIFLTINKIQKIIPTLLAERFCDGLGIDPCENRIGNIRTECNGNHSIENVFNSPTRYEYLKYAIKDLNIKEDRPTRLNLGGCRTSVGEMNFDFTIDDQTFADLIMKICYYQNATKEEIDVCELRKKYPDEHPILIVQVTEGGDTILYT